MAQEACIKSIAKLPRPHYLGTEEKSAVVEVSGVELTYGYLCLLQVYPVRRLRTGT